MPFICLFRLTYIFADFDTNYLVFFWFVYAAGVFCDDEIDLVNVNTCKELTKVQKPQTQWSKPWKNHDKILNNYVNLPRKSHTYRIQQPRTVIYSWAGDDHSGSPGV
jgi:hypothetical protein